MSTQTEREAAARAFYESARRTEDEVVFGDAINVKRGGWFLPNGVDSAKYGGIPWDDIACAWVVHVRALDAVNAAPVAPDPLAGVVWADPERVIRFCENEPGVTCGMDGDLYCAHTSVPDEVIVAHAHAQLARGSSPAAVAVTLEDATTAPAIRFPVWCNSCPWTGRAVDGLVPHRCPYCGGEWTLVDGTRALGVTPAVLS